MTPDIAALLQKSKRSLTAAKAALLTRGKSYSKHTAIINGFYHEFVATGVLPKQLHADFHYAFDDRNLGDYGFMESFPEEEARKLLHNAEHFITEVSKMIKAQEIT